MQGSQAVIRKWVIVALLAGVLSGCPLCAPKAQISPFHGFESRATSQIQLSSSGGKIELHTSEIGKVTVDFSAGSISGSEKVELFSGVIPEIDQAFSTHPYTGKLKKFPGGLRLIFGKTAPKKDIAICFERSRVFESPSGGTVIPLVYYYYDGESETLSYFEAAEHHPAELGSSSECLELRKEQFSNLDNSENRFETIIIFAEKMPGK